MSIDTPEIRYLLGISVFFGSVLVAWWFVSKNNKKTAASTSALALKGLVRKPAFPVPISAMNAITLKHMMTDARDCRIQWEVDFGRMTLTLHADFISPELLLLFLHTLPRSDDRFTKAGIIGAVCISERFDVRLELPTGTIFKLYSYQSPIGKQPEIELFEHEEKGVAR